MKRKYNSALFLKQLNFFFKNVNLSMFIDRYKKNGWKVEIDKYLLIIKTEKNIYHLGITDNRDKYFWILSSSDKVYFELNFNFHECLINDIIEIIEDIEKT